jgi:mono/diheme cytochrome c family protein
MRVQWIGVLIVGSWLAVSGCTPKEAAQPEPKAEPAPAPTPAPAAEAAADPVAAAAEIFQNRCTVCHGETGKGDGAGSAALDPKPRDFTSAEWQASVTDDHLKKIIAFGGSAVGKAATMPANPDLDVNSDVVAELVKLIRDLAK